jgi:nucleotide-binding universal stress UspA family protein
VTGAATERFRRTVCGIDGSVGAEESAREAAVLAPDAGTVFLVGVIDPDLADSLPMALPGGTPAPEEARRRAAVANLDTARRAVRGGVTVATTVRVGPPGPVLEAEAARVLADTVAVGSHGHGRAVGLVLGSAATWLIHNAAASVLIARATTGEPFPRSIAVGLDGSEPSLRALHCGRELAGRLGVPLRVVHVLDGRFSAGALRRDLDLDEEVEEIRVDWSAAEGLAAAVNAADLLIVGSRGLQGIRALGSVSEAVAHRAAASVLVYR